MKRRAREPKVWVHLRALIHISLLSLRALGGSRVADGRLRLGWKFIKYLKEVNQWLRKRLFIQTNWHRVDIG